MGCAKPRFHRMFPRSLARSLACTGKSMSDMNITIEYCNS